MNKERAMQATEQERLTGKENITQVTKFVLFSISAGIIQVIVFALMLEALHVPYWLSYLTALIASVIYNFTVNRRFTFKSANNIPLAMIQLGIYYAIFTPLSTWWGDALVGLGWHEYLVLGLTMVTNLITEFCVNRFVIYRNSMNTRATQTNEHTPLSTR
jgi:putative flippase GtrA